jgi:hypothetical protein
MQWRGEIPPDARAFTLPDWIEHAWPVLDADQGIAQALNAVYEDAVGASAPLVPSLPRRLEAVMVSVRA